MSPAGRAPATPFPAPDDAALLARARAGDAGAFEAVVSVRLAGCWRLARAILGADDGASEAVTNALLAAWRELPRLEDPERFDEWLDRIVLSECRMRLADAGRAGVAGPMPAGLLERTMVAVHAAPPRSAGGMRSRGRVRRPGPGARATVGVALVTVAVVAAVAFVVPGLVGNRGGAAVVAPSTSPSPAGTPAAPTSAGSTELPGSSPTTVGGDDLRVGSLAIVTLVGNDLRVRSLPTVADTSKRLKPLLPAGTRMLVVDGPVEADGYAWWKVQTDGELVDLFGWVAAADGDEQWIAPTTPRCFGPPDARAVTGLTRVDFLVCHGSTEVRVQADAASLWDVREIKGDCGWVRRRDGCDVDTAWLLLASTTVRVQVGAGEQRDLVVAMPPDLAAALARLPRQRQLTLTVSMDSPEARSCRVRDGRSGATLVPDDGAIIHCRLQFVVQEIAFRQ